MYCTLKECTLVSVHMQSNANIQHSPHHHHVARSKNDVTSSNAAGASNSSSFTPVSASSSRHGSLPTPPRPLSNHTPTIVPPQTGAHAQRTLVNGPLSISGLEHADKTEVGAGTSPAANDASAHKFASAANADSLNDIAALVCQETNNVRTESHFQSSLFVTSHLLECFFFVLF